ncbi:MAG: tRNA (N(6)-L-threonylcarbamoyladenosine(37)-C(2))-methylthiotransferase MtaB [Erysipelotrichaceae bacterium]
MVKFSIATLGCKVNAYESEGYVQGLLDYGYEQVDFKDVADIYIINTCAVTNTASSKSRQKINQAIKQNPDAFVCVVGCYAQTSEADVLKMENVDLIVGTNGKASLAAKIKEGLASRDRKERTSLVETSRSHNVFEALSLQKYQKQTRAYLKIQDGCNQFCSYCIIPYARGVERSLPLADVVAQAKTLVANGHLELVLAGIHTGRYGHDLGIDLVVLIETLLKEVTGLKRIRISSIEIGEITDGLLDLMERDSRVARHLHIPLQAANDVTLQAMNRRYDMATFEKRVAAIRERFSDISISSDLIAGFPNESEAQHKDGVLALERLAFSFIHVFPYSKRDNTVAANMPNHHNNDVKKMRANEISGLSNRMYHQFKQTFIGTTLDVILESSKEGKLFGHSSQYLPVLVTGNQALLHTLVKVKIETIDGLNLIGTIIKED